MNNKTFGIVIAVIIIAGIISLPAYLQTQFDTAQEAQMADFPKVIGERSGMDIPLTERDYEILETKNLIMRDYKNSAGDSVYLYIVYSAGNRKVVHPPEICYSGGGATIIEKTIIPVTNRIEANKFTIEDKNSQQLVVYWFRAGNSNIYSYMQQQLKMVTNRTLGRKTSGAMVRVSTLIKDDNQDAALALIKEFCVEIEPLLEQYVP